MALQKQVNQVQALGFGGQVAKGRNSYFQTTTGVSVDDKVVIGSFVQTTDKEGEFKGLSASVGGKIAGLAIFDNFRDGSADSASVAKGDTFTILQVGSAYIETDKEAKAGQKVAIKIADGTVEFKDDIASTHINTGFIVEKGNAVAKSSGVVLITTARACI